ncbi:MAG TPA: NAD(P)-dependent oxidoreductase [Candidatus Methylomirabilis sp.]|nr:NAD(P)-dependent oxidoreductase [Candidatus Methylomirabilis sp.]
MGAYLVTGGTGFIGAYVVRDLLASDHRVAVFDLFPDLPMLELVAGPAAAERVSVIRGDVTIATQIFGAVREAGAEAIVHLASPLPPESERDASSSLYGITEGHVNVLETARILGLRRVVWASVTSVFGRPEHHGGLDAAVANDAPHFPETLYGIWKSANERLASLYFARFGVDSIGLRFNQGYGPGKKRGRPFGYQLFEHALLGLPYRVPYGDDLVNWQYVEDIAALIVRALHAPTTRTRVFNTTGEVVTMRDTAALLASMLPGARLELEPGRAGLVWRVDTTALRDELGAGAPVPVREGFARTIATLRGWKEAGKW